MLSIGFLISTVRILKRKFVSHQAPLSFFLCTFRTTLPVRCLARFRSTTFTDHFLYDVVPSTTFYSIHVWNSEEDDDDWNPGDYDLAIGQEIAQCIRKAAEQAPRWGPLFAELNAGYGSIERANDH